MRIATWSIARAVIVGGRARLARARAAAVRPRQIGGSGAVEGGSVAVVIGLLALGLGSSSSVRAQVPDSSTASRAMIVRVDGDLLVLDLAAPSARVGLALEVHRTIEARHPVTRRVLRDHFVIGRLRLEQVSSTLSMARALESPLRPIEVGDWVERDRVGAAQELVAGPPAPAERPPSPEPCPACPAAAATDRETSEIVGVWRASLGRSPEERIRLYGIYLRRNPGSPHTAFVQAEISAMRALVARAAARDGGWEPATPTRAPDVVSGGRLERVREGYPADVALSVAAGVGIRGLLLHARRGGEGYRTIGMPLDIGGHAVARIPRGLVRAPSFEYFVEAVGSDGRTLPVVASAEVPVQVEVVRSASSAVVERERSRVRVSAELASFDGISQRDWYFITEADFLYRVQQHALYSVRVGYGIYRGEGGPLARLDDPVEPSSDEAGFTYGYFETEIRFFELLSLIPRVSVGLGRPDGGGGQMDGLRGGFQLRARIGRERGTHLVLAAETVPEIGERAFIGLSAELVERLPMALEVHVTDQPADADELGVRLVYEIGLRPLDTFALAARLSYQGRRIDHTGFGAGLAATFDW